MKQFVKKLSIFCLLLSILVGTDAYGEITESEDKTLSKETLEMLAAKGKK